jgi:hypothetical protein
MERRQGDLGGGGTLWGPGRRRIQARIGMAIYGGFPDNGSAYTPAMRTFAAADTSMIENSFGSIFTVAGASETDRNANVTIDGFKLHYSSFENAGKGVNLIHTANVAIRNTLFILNIGMGIPILASDGGFKAENCRFSGHGSETPMVTGGGTEVAFTGCEFSGNRFAASYSVQVDVSGWKAATFTNTLFLDPLAYPSGTDNHYIRYTDSTGTLNVTGCTFKAKDIPAMDVPPGTKGVRTSNVFAP